MWLIYYVLCALAFALAAPFLAILSIFSEKHKVSIPARFFLKTPRIAPKSPAPKNAASTKSPPPREGANLAANPSLKAALKNATIWIHACSLGEVSALSPILANLPQDSRTVLSATTFTGYQKALSLAPKNARVIFLPFEIFLPFLMPKTLQKLVVLEAELWFMLFFCAQKVGAKTILLNARISQRSLPKYQRFAFFYRRLFAHIDLVLCQSQKDKENLAALGARNIAVCGNIKAYATFKVTKNYARFNGDVIVAASTHRGEEELVLSAYAAAFGGNPGANLGAHGANPNARLLIAPRHPERFGEVRELLARSSLSYAAFSEVGLDFNYQVLLIDALGELINLYAIANLVILGGSFVKVGGHNPLECAFFGTKILSGEFIFNQHALFSLIEGAKIIKKDELAENLKNMRNLKNARILPPPSPLDSLLKVIF